MSDRESIQRDTQSEHRLLAVACDGCGGEVAWVYPDDYGRARRELLAPCENCEGRFCERCLAVVPDVDTDLRWCPACREVCACGHIKGTHGVGCDGHNGNGCGCRKFIAREERAMERVCA